ncbi:hypothetical protein QBC40DRAFT_346608 [Triangularia verruculosa]|uniref:Uncharacterized protein n=1 Tax=Triangularia verruculosa TaxID=2587418 RepID=A0AAN7AXS5_9PEZI|nr:hypothetical protein QBC40DRAFT_346608 [Triangularia verruculosa]
MAYNYDPNNPNPGDKSAPSASTSRSRKREGSPSTSNERSAKHRQLGHNARVPTSASARCNHQPPVLKAVDQTSFIQNPPGLDHPNDLTDEEKAWWAQPGRKVLESYDASEIRVAPKGFGADSRLLNIQSKDDTVNWIADDPTPGHPNRQVALIGLTAENADALAASIAQTGWKHPHGSLARVRIEPQFLSGVYHFSDFLALSAGILGEKETVVQQMLASDAFKAQYELPWSRESAKMLLNMHPRDFNATYHQESRLPRDNTWSNPTTKKDVLVRWIREVVNQDYPWDSIFVTDRYIPEYWVNKLLHPENGVADLHRYLFSAFESEATDILMARGAVTERPAPGNPGGPVLKFLQVGDYTKARAAAWKVPEFQKNADGTPKIELVAFGRFWFGWTDGPGDMILYREYRRARHLSYFSFSRPAIHYWVNMWLDDLLSKKTLLGKLYAAVDALELRPGLKVLFEALWEKWRAQQRPSSET